MRIFLKLVFLPLILTALLHLIAVRFYLYWNIAWFDSGVHFFGGFFVSGLFLYFIDRFLSENKNIKFKMVFMFVLTVGILWEFFEIYFDITSFGDKNYVISFVSDIFFDLVGSFVAYRYFLFLIKQRTTLN